MSFVVLYDANLLYPSTLRDLLVRIAQSGLVQAIKARAQVIVTNNRKDFPPRTLSQWDIDPKDADEFVLDQIGLNAKVVWSCVQQIANSWRRPPATIGDVLSGLERSGLVQSVAELRAR